MKINHLKRCVFVVKSLSGEDDHKVRNIRKEHLEIA